MKVNINDLAPRPAFIGFAGDITASNLAQEQQAAATELSLDDMKKYSGTGIYLLSAVVD